MLISEETTNISWYCKNCNQGAKSIMTKICKLNERQERVENGLVMLTELHQNLNDRITSLGSSLEACMNTQENETEERFSAMESVFTLRMQKLKTQSVDGAADMAREMEDRQDRANNIIMFSRKPYNKEAQEMLSVIPEDRSKDAWIAATWKQEWEASGPTRVHRHISDQGEGVKGEDLRRKHWTK